MITLPASVRVYLCTVVCDMRRGFDGLKMLAEQVVGVDPLGGHLARVPRSARRSREDPLLGP